MREIGMAPLKSIIIAAGGLALTLCAVPADGQSSPGSIDPRGGCSNQQLSDEQRRRGSARREQIVAGMGTGTPDESENRSLREEQRGRAQHQPPLARQLHHDPFPSRSV